MTNVKLNLAKKGKTKFKILDIIGQGAQGTVYRVQNGVESYALKQYDQFDDFSVKAQRRARKIGELITQPQTGALSRAWSVDAGEDQDQNPIMLYKLFNHRAIEDYHDSFNRPKHHRVRERIAVGLIAGVVEIHRNKIVHADLAPINVLYSSRGEVAIIDFDGAGYLPKLTNSNGFDPMVKGHVQFPGWVAPHELMGNNGQATFGTDIWWTGSILTKILSNFSPFFFLKVADKPSLKELAELVGDSDQWPPSYESIMKHSKAQPNLTPTILDKVRKVLNTTIATATLGQIFLNYTEPDARPTAVNLWTSFRSRVFR